MLIELIVRLYTLLDTDPNPNPIQTPGQSTASTVLHFTQASKALNSRAPCSSHPNGALLSPQGQCLYSRSRSHILGHSTGFYFIVGHLEQPQSIYDYRYKTKHIYSKIQSEEPVGTTCSVCMACLSLRTLYAWVCVYAFCMLCKPGNIQTSSRRNLVHLVAGLCI